MDLFAGLPEDFGVLDITELEEIPQIKDAIKTITNNKICLDCNAPLMRSTHTHAVCTHCGKEVESEIQSDKPIMLTTSFRIAGTTRFVGGVTQRTEPGADRTVREGRIVERLLRREAQFKNMEDSIPPSALKRVAALYVEIQDNEAVVKRAGGLMALLTILIYNVCIELGVPKKPKMITQLTGVKDSQLSKGESQLRKLVTSGCVKIPEGCGSYSDFIDQYLYKLGIAPQHEVAGSDENGSYIRIIMCKDFCIDLINATQNKKIPDSGNSARPTTRCAGVICILAKQLKLDVNRDMISEKCMISKSTFARFVNMVVTHREKPFVRRVFVNHHVPELTN